MYSRSLSHLPQLKIEKSEDEPHRRDYSITSTKTNDSGYNSDPEVSLSPTEFCHPDQHFLSVDSTLLPRFSETFATAVGCGRTTKIQIVFNHGLHSDQEFSPQLNEEPHWPTATRHPAISSKPTSATTPALDRAYLLPEKVNTRPADELAPLSYRPNERISSITSLSSEGSGGDYSLTEDSECDDPPSDNPAMLSKATLATIELVMRKIELNLTYATYVQCAGGKRARNTETPSSRRGSAAQQGSQGSGSKRKAQGGSDGLLPEDDDENGTNKRRRVSVTTNEDSEGGPRFACPFYKHDPSRYRNRRTCPGPGWPTVHRMKEHLYRSHAQPIFCPRCYTMFDADTDLSRHLRSDPCSMSAPQPIDGIDRETLKSLRKRSPPLRLEEDKWRDTYHLLFPDVSEADIPSPYYDGDSPTEESRRFRRELLRRIQMELFTTAEQQNSAVEQNLLRQVAGIIQRCETQLLDDFYQEATVQPSARTTPPPAVTDSHPNIVFTPVEPSHIFQHHPSINTPLPESSPATLSMTYRTHPSTSHAQYQPLSGFNDHHHTPGQLDAGQYPAGPWDSPSDYIDWNVVFPPGPQQSSENGGPALFTMPVWT